MNEVVLREATAADAELLVAVIQSAFDEYRGRLDPPSGAHDESVAGMRSWLAKAGACLAFASERPAGCVLYEPAAGIVNLSRLSVLPDARRLGLGGALVQFVEQRARALNLPRVQLAVRLGLTNLTSWYEARGYHVIEVGSHQGYTQPTYAVLEKEVGDEDEPGAGVVLKN